MGVIFALAGAEYVITDMAFEPVWIRSFCRKRWISYPLIGLVALALTPIGMALGPLVSSLALINEWFSGSIDARLQIYVRIPLKGILGVLVYPIMVLACVWGILIAHVVGVIYIFIKIYIAIRRCKEPNYMRPPNYAQF